MSEQVSIYPTEMSGQKRTRGEADNNGCDSAKNEWLQKQQWIGG